MFISSVFSSNSENCCQAIHEASDDKKNSIVSDAKLLMKRFVDQIAGADEDETVAALYGIFEDYVDIRNCIADKFGDDVDIKKDLGIMLSMRSPKLTLEIFGNPHLYADDVKLIVDNIDDSTFGKNAFFCQNDKCNKHSVESDVSDIDKYYKYIIYYPINVQTELFLQLNYSAMRFDSLIQIFIFCLEINATVYEKQINLYALKFQEQVFIS